MSGNAFRVAYAAIRAREADATPNGRRMGSGVHSELADAKRLGRLNCNRTFTTTLGRRAKAQSLPQFFILEVLTCFIGSCTQSARARKSAATPTHL